MAYTLRPAASEDQPFLWQMLFYAANMADDGATSGDEAKTHPYLAKYVRDWGRPGDVGALALAAEQPIGAAWVRVLEGAEKNYPAVADGIPELAVAMRPEYVGQGIGGRLMERLFELTISIHPAIVLSVREANPARRLYERLGFVVVETTVNRVGGKSFVMLKQLR